MQLPLGFVVAADAGAQLRLGILELLLDVADHGVAHQARENRAYQLGPDFSRPRDGASEGHELANVASAQVPELLELREVDERDVVGLVL